jgi:hypothetical protein
MVLKNESAIDPRWSHRASDRIESLYPTHIKSICGVGMPIQRATMRTLAVDLSPRTEDPMPDSWAGWMLFVNKVKLLLKEIDNR